MTLAADRRAALRRAMELATCPSCGQPPGSPCITVTGLQMLEIHSARKGEAWRIGRTSN